MLNPIKTLVVFAALLPFAGLATEAETPPVPVPTLKFEPSLSKVDQKVAKLFGEDKQKALRQVAQAAVLTDFCAAINLNQAKFKQAFAELAGGGTPRKPDEQRNFENKLAMYFGVYVGILVAEGADRRAEFCGFAESALKEQRPISQFWIATAQGFQPAQP